MTAQTIHDALTLLPGDLVEQTDKKRRFPARVIPWKRYAALAACLALMLCSGWTVSRLDLGGAKESAAPEAPAMAAVQDTVMEQIEAPAEAEAYPEENELCGLPPAPAAGSSAQNLPEGIVSLACVQTPPAQDSAICFSAQSRIRLLSCRADLDAYLETYRQQYDLTQLESQCENLTESWFAEQDLLLLAVHGISAETSCPVQILGESNGLWEIVISNHLADGAAMDLQILIGAEKNRIPSEDAVVLIFE